MLYWDYTKIIGELRENGYLYKTDNFYWNNYKFQKYEQDEKI